MKIILDVVDGPHRGSHFEFHQHATFLVGRNAKAHLRLADDSHFSRHHFLMELAPPHCYLRDMDSTNGTFVNGRRVTEAFLGDGDVISGGKTRIRAAVRAAGAPAAGAPVMSSASSTVDRPAPRPRPLPTVSGPSPSEPWPSHSSLDSGSAPPAHFVPGYELIRMLGQGGMGAVYLARQLANGQDVALKLVVPESAASERAMQLFLREVSVLSQLDHPRVVRFREMGLAHGQFFFAMEYVEAIDVMALLSGLSEAARIRVACALIAQVLSGLAHAHARSFVHRDVKPANILVSRRGSQLEAKLADFGLAKNFENAGFSGITRAGQALGTMTTMAPEQVIDARSATPAVDIYSTGSTLYQLLTGRPPYRFPKGRYPMLVILEDDPIPLTRLLPAAPPGLARLVHRALAREPTDRFPTAEAMREALRRYARGERVS